MRRALCFAAGVILLAACESGSARDLSLRQATKSYRFTITAHPAPPYANEPVNYTVTVLDRETEQPVQNGEGQIYGQLTPGPDGRPRTWDSFVYGPEVGTYHARLRFAISSINNDPNEAWQMGLRFRRDSLSPMEITTWAQQVLPERDSIPKQ
jgi:hypothetical protein